MPSGCFNACREAAGIVLVRVALAIIHDMDVGKKTRARLTAAACERPQWAARSGRREKNGNS